MEKSDIEVLFKPAHQLRRLGATLSAPSEEPNFPAANLIDSNPSTIWHTEYTARQPGFPHDLTAQLPAETLILSVILTQRTDKSRTSNVSMETGSLYSAATSHKTRVAIKSTYQLTFA